MTDTPDFDASTKARWREFRDQSKRESKERWARMKQNKESLEIEDVIIAPESVDWNSFCGTEVELTYAVEHLYANGGRDFDPRDSYPPSMITSYGKDYALHARGIYYRQYTSKDTVTCSRKIWIPSWPESHTQSPEMNAVRQRARILAEHCRDNERWNKSEYAWEADAWSDMFRPLRDDECLAVDKHEYLTLLPETDPISCRLTGTSKFVRRRPDATFGLATFRDRHASSPVWVSELQSHRLARLMLHPKYGLISDPQRLGNDLAFPFMVYEAKGWSGDCREARSQACSAAAVYLDMLDELARRPGPVGTQRPYQTKTSHQYQVFVLTSFGAYWHLLVGHRRPRLLTEHAGSEGLSENVYIFQHIWSGHVIFKEKAEVLISLIEQIHLWAITEHRAFVLEHLRAWHQSCEENYLLEWDFKYDIPAQAHKKRKRIVSTAEDMLAPAWVADMDEPSKRTFQLQSKFSLAKAIQEHRQIRGKDPDREDTGVGWICARDGCQHECTSDTAFIHHSQADHDLDDCGAAKLRWLFHETDTRERIRDRQKRGVTSGGHKMPWALDIIRKLQQTGHGNGDRDGDDDNGDEEDMGQPDEKKGSEDLRVEGKEIYEEEQESAEAASSSHVLKRRKISI